jgi:hypothetical protein
VFGIVLICVLIGDLCLVVMDDDEDVVCIEAPVPTNARTPRPVARNGGAVRVRFNGEGSKSASSPVCPTKFKKHRRAPREYVRPKEWKVVRRYATGGRAQLDTEDIDFDIYKKARELMESSGMIMLPQQEVQAGGVHLWQLRRQATSASNGFAIREFQCPMRHLCKCNVGLRIVEGPGFMQLERLGMHDRQSHVTPPRRALMESIQDENGPPDPEDSDDDEEAEEDEDSEDVDSEDEDSEDDDDDDADDDDSGYDRAQDSGEEAQLPGM